MHRTLSITVPPAATEVLVRQLNALDDVVGLGVQAGASRKPPGDVLTVHVLNRGADEVLRRARAAVPDATALSIVTSEAASFIAPAQAKRIVKDKDEAVWEEMETGLRHQARVTPNYAGLMALGGVMAAVGLVSDPVPQVIAFIASSIISPGFEPLAKIPLGVVLRRWPLVWRGLGASVVGYALFMLTAGLTMAWLLAAGESTATDLATNPEVANIARPGLKEILVSAGGAAAGVVILAAYRRSVIAGALIALVLMPAAALVGAGLAIGRAHLAFEGLQRFGLDAALVVGVGLLVFSIKQLAVHRRRPLE